MKHDRVCVEEVDELVEVLLLSRRRSGVSVFVLSACQQDNTETTRLNFMKLVRGRQAGPGRSEWNFGVDPLIRCHFVLHCEIGNLRFSLFRGLWRDLSVTLLMGCLLKLFKCNSEDLKVGTSKEIRTSISWLEQI